MENAEKTKEKILPSVSLVVPAFNEEEILEETIEIFRENLSSICDEYEIIIVIDDGIRKHMVNINNNKRPEGYQYFNILYNHILYSISIFFVPKFTAIK